MIPATFLQAIREAPDDVPRLAYADWLEERFGSGLNEEE